MECQYETTGVSVNGAQDTAGLLAVCQCGHDRIYHTREGRCVRHQGTCPCRTFMAASGGASAAAAPLGMKTCPPHLTADGDYACAVAGCGHALSQHDNPQTRCHACADGHGFVFVLSPPAPQRFCTEAEAWATIGRRRTPV